MPSDPLIQYWVNYGSSFRREGTVHRVGCDWESRGYGRWLTPEDLIAEQPQAIDCKVCGGRYQDDDISDRARRRYEPRRGQPR